MEVRNTRARARRSTVGFFLFVTFVAPHSLPAADSAVADLGQGIASYNSRDFQGAINHLRGRQVPRLSDYVTYYLASSEQQAHDFEGALAVLTSYRQNPVASSPLAGKISLLNARVLLDVQGEKHDSSASAKALEILLRDSSLLPQPDGYFALALAYEAQDEKTQAAFTYERIYYAWPNTDLAAQSWTAMERLRATMGAEFPNPLERQRLDRCENWLKARQYRQARLEYSALADSLTGAGKEEAQVGIGVADYLSGDARAALRSLKALHVDSPPADARRLYYITESARKTGDDTAMLAAVNDLAARYPKSDWRLKAIMAAGYRFIATNERDKYTPLFKDAVDTFPPDITTAFCHWKLTWDAYLAVRPERTTLLREQVERYPADIHASAALYFLGRIAEKDGNPAEARAYYDRLASQYPHYFYGVLAADRVKDTKLAALEHDPADIAWLGSITWPVHRDLSSSEPNTATRQRLDRAHLLAQAGLPDLAESELRFGAGMPHEQPQLLALDLAGLETSPFRALRVMKSFSSDYLALPNADAPSKFWEMLFPLPYKDEVFNNATQRGIDPFNVAALIRQESEFNPGAKSPANAYGLMQLIPSTGRMLGRMQGLGSINTRKLLEPAINISLGTQYLRDQLNAWGQDWYKTLAAYNAGPSRVREWSSWAEYNEPAEFVESIPYNETREYVQAVLRNAAMYHDLYSGKPVPHLAEPAPLLKAAAKPVPGKKTTAVVKTATIKSVNRKKTTTPIAVTSRKRDPA